jgi:peptidoglycan/LPS O-acetylase OafA/YrhL
VTTAHAPSGRDLGDGAEVEDAPPGRRPLPLRPSSNPRRGRFTYHASLDGLRALALIAIFAYHLEYSWARGAYLSVDLFFVLSGFLITTLLVKEWQLRGGIRLPEFWSRRARRLLPALLVTLGFVAVFTQRVLDPWNRVDVRNDGLASLFYVANWRFIADKQSYFGLFTAASPLRHMWTLAIEEQFYIVWPIVVVLALRAGRGSLRVLTAVCVAAVGLSVAVMAGTFDPGDVDRAYYGTDARAHVILIGALLALLFAVWTPGEAARRRFRMAGPVAFGAMLLSWWLATGTSARYYHGGSVVYAGTVCVVIAAALQPGLLARGLAVGPLAWIGRLSYGLYLFHWPVIVWLVPTRVHVHGLALNVLRVAVTVLLASLTYYVIELPVRERRLPTVAQWAMRRGRAAADDRRSPPRRPIARWVVAPAVAITLVAVRLSTHGATAPPSYLSGVQPKGLDFVWGWGDPSYCPGPQPFERDQAAAEAHDLGAPDLDRPVAGLRVMVIGDSVACSLFTGLSAVGNTVGADVQQASVFGCGVASGAITTTRGEQITPNSDRCPRMVELLTLPALEQFKPDVVVWASIWEKSDLQVGDRVLRSGTPEGDREMLRRMDDALAKVTAHGARVVVLNLPPAAPNDAQGTGETSNAVDDASYARLTRINRLFAERHPNKVTLVDLSPRVCPGGPPCPLEVDGMRMRPDGRHFTPKASVLQAHWLFPQLVDALPR